MTFAKVLVSIGFLVVVVAIVAAGYVVSRRRSQYVVPGEPDRVSGDVVSGLMSELRKSQAEAAYWKAAAERLQRDADER